MSESINGRWFYGGPSTHYMQMHVRTSQLAKVPKFSTVLSPLYKSLCSLKGKIDYLENQSVWDEYKKVINPYEFVFLSLTKRMQYSVAKKIPLSRSYFKMVEIWHTLIKDNLKNDTLFSAHSAEGPGGFVEACISCTALAGITYKGSLAMTLKSSDKNIPGWRKSQSFLQDNPLVEITYGDDGTGDLYNIMNHKAFADQLSSKCDGADLYTADGGFDFSTDFNNQEENMIPLLLAELILCLKTLKKNGLCIIKIFDTVLLPTVELLYIGTRAFQRWTLFKPKTSRAANSEKYLVCSGFIGADQEVITELENALNKTTKKEYIQNFLHPEMHKNPEYKEFERQLIDLQTYFSTQQISAIEKTLAAIKDETSESLKEIIHENIIHSIEWCNNFNMELNPLYYENNNEELLNTLVEEIRTSNKSSYSSAAGALRRYPREHFPQLRKPDVAMNSPPPYVPFEPANFLTQRGYSHRVESWKIGAEIRSGSWETVKRQRKGYSVQAPFQLQQPSDVHAPTS